jgi:hypothetical protein
MVNIDSSPVFFEQFEQKNPDYRQSWHLSCMEKVMKSLSL